METPAFDDERREDVRRRTLALLSRPWANEHVSVENHRSIEDVICDRLAATIQVLQEDSVSHSTTGRQQQHLLLQAIADPTLGSADPFLRPICARMGAVPKTVNICFQERKDYNLGYFPTTARRKGAIEPWLIQVTCLSCLSCLSCLGR